MAYLYERRVAFADTDAGGRVHFSRLFCYVEEAEHTLLAELKLPVLDGGGWPRVHVECDYFAPVGMGDEVEVILIPEKVGSTSVRWSFHLLHRGQDVAKGGMKTVRVDEKGKPVVIPEDWRIKLEGV
ncbi:acyl-CoA thioesterase [Verrucomicrobiaceae bacterium N1E253]|uniref:Acyl-CoA thioesterase n=1 Tax=Oceaniferula marina TaxID=2748318 RepID=A0A851GPE9_9BACT|nr:thioesterase family protein [Oceaniferula marina]NWK56897.1 acyl-CoA thioesterase [Oceaniferula marina]